MTTHRENLADAFEQHRGRLTAVAQRMLGTRDEAEDAVQEAWLRLTRASDAEVANLGGWLTTVVARVCLDILKARKIRLDPERRRFIESPEVTLDDHVAATFEPEAPRMLADSVSVALFVVLESLTPPERLAYVLHDTFDIEFEEIARILSVTPESARQYASRARRRLSASAPAPGERHRAGRALVDAFLLAARSGNFDDLIRTLHPDVAVFTAPVPEGPAFEGAENVARRSILSARVGARTVPVLVSGELGALSFTETGSPVALLTFVIEQGLIARIHAVTDRSLLNEVARALGDVTNTPAQSRA